MSDSEPDIYPSWMDDESVKPGQYVWHAAVQDCAFRDLESEKPYGLISCIVTEGEEAGYKFSFRMYIHQTARRWAVYFLKKFDYPAELLNAEKPALRRAAIVGLQGKIWAEITVDDRGPRVDVKGFDRLDGLELEERLLKQQQATLAAEADAPVMDLEQDIKQAQAAEGLPDWLDS